ncbi:MAG: hypothetical protein KKC75_04305 [Nanoarchaeota archaeon]|nr:hypothetical protein [Nanoarchaeota archaeon]MBU1004593.1 hypothetical protein [Nanoarchaeota archaeon]MBU1946981.1 hypothetical protein [Nanoarchaeota archaeon]
MVEDKLDLFKNFEADHSSKKEDKKKSDKDEIEIKIRLSKKWFNKLFLERSIFIVIILILAVLVFYNPFGKYTCEKGLSDIKTEPVVKTENTSPGPVAVEAEPVVEIEIEPEPEPDQSSGPAMSGKATIDIKDVSLDANKTKVLSITVNIDNQMKILTPTVWVYWYDSGSTAAMKAFTIGGKFNYTGAIPLGVKNWKLDDLDNSRLRVDDKTKETFKIEMYDASDGSLLDTVTKTFST